MCSIPPITLLARIRTIVPDNIVSTTPYWRDPLYLVWLLLGCGIAALASHNSYFSLDLNFSFRNLLFIGMIYPILEEITFRGFLTDIFLKLKFARDSFSGISGANLLTTFCFAFFHWAIQQNSLALLVLFPSLLYGWTRERYDNLYAPIILHICFNLMLIVF